MGLVLAKLTDVAHHTGWVVQRRELGIVSFAAVHLLGAQNHILNILLVLVDAHCRLKSHRDLPVLNVLLIDITHVKSDSVLVLLRLALTWMV